MLQKALVRANAAAEDNSHADPVAPSVHGCGHRRTGGHLSLRAGLFKQSQDDDTFYVHVYVHFAPAYVRHLGRGHRPVHWRQGGVGEEQSHARRLHHEH